MYLFHNNYFGDINLNKEIYCKNLFTFFYFEISFANFATNREEKKTLHLNQKCREILHNIPVFFSTSVVELNKKIIFRLNKSKTFKTFFSSHDFCLLQNFRESLNCFIINNEMFLFFISLNIWRALIVWCSVFSSSSSSLALHHYC